MFKKISDRWRGFIDRKIWNLIGRHQVILLIDDQIVLNAPLLSVIEYKKSGAYDANWNLKIYTGA